MLEALGVEPGVELVYRALLARPGDHGGRARRGRARRRRRCRAGALATLVGAGLALRSARA